MNIVRNLLHRTRPGDVGLPLYLLGCLAMGGATREGFAMHGFLAVVGFGILIYFLFFAKERALSRTALSLRTIAVLAIGLALLQLVPLPPFIWTMLPGRDAIVRGFEAMGMDLPWLGVSLTPERSAYAILSLIPALAVATAALNGSRRSIDLCLGFIIGFALGSTVLGFMQIASGNYPYEITNRGAPTGFFANSNHLATLLMVTIPALAAVFKRVGDKVASTNKRLALQFILASVAAVAAAGLLSNGSRAGLIIGLVAFLSAAAILFYGRKSSPPARFLRLVLIGIPVGALVLMIAVLMNFLGADVDPSSLESRSVMLKTSLEAAMAYFPAGSGLGSFPIVYPQFENPQEVSTVFVNHAHNDYAELLVETGLFGIAILILFAAWYYRRVLAIWTGTGQGVVVARLGTVGIALILLHSAVDYPARSIAIMSLAGFFLALMAEPSLHGRSSSSGRRHTKHRVVH